MELSYKLHQKLCIWNKNVFRSPMPYSFAQLTFTNAIPCPCVCTVNVIFFLTFLTNCHLTNLAYKLYKTFQPMKKLNHFLRRALSCFSKTSSKLESKDGMLKTVGNEEIANAIGYGRGLAEVGNVVYHTAQLYSTKKAQQQLTLDTLQSTETNAQVTVN